MYCSAGQARGEGRGRARQEPLGQRAWVGVGGGGRQHWQRRRRRRRWRPPAASPRHAQARSALRCPPAGPCICPGARARAHTHTHTHTTAALFAHPRCAGRSGRTSQRAGPGRSPAGPGPAPHTTAGCSAPRLCGQRRTAGVGRRRRRRRGVGGGGGHARAEGRVVGALGGGSARKRAWHPGAGGAQGQARQHGHATGCQAPHAAVGAPRGIPPAARAAGPPSHQHDAAAIQVAHRQAVERCGDQAAPAAHQQRAHKHLCVRQSLCAAAGSTRGRVSKREPHGSWATARAPKRLRQPQQWHRLQSRAGPTSKLNRHTPGRTAAEPQLCDAAQQQAALEQLRRHGQQPRLQAGGAGDARSAWQRHLGCSTLGTPLRPHKAARAQAVHSPTPPAGTARRDPPPWPAADAHLSRCAAVAGCQPCHK